MSRLCPICRTSYYDPMIEECCVYCQPPKPVELSESEKNSLLLWKVDHHEQPLADKWGLTLEEMNRLAFVRFLLANGKVEV